MPSGPVRDQRDAHAAAVRVLLVPAQRRVADLRPAPGIVGRAAQPADLGEVRLHLVGILRPPHEEARLVGLAARAAFLRRAVVGHQQDDRVVELVRGLQVIDQPADLRVGVIEEGGERFLQRDGEALRVLRHVVPGIDARIAGSQLGPVGDDAELLLTRVDLLAHLVPAGVESSAVLVEIGLRRLMRRMGRARREVEEKRLPGINRLVIAQEANRVVGQVLGQVIAILRRLGRRDEMIVVGQLGVELIGLAAEEAVVAVEAALQRPLVERTGLRGFLHWREMPLAQREGRVVLVAQHFGDGRRVARDRPAHVRIARVEVADRTHADCVMISPGQQRGAGRRAERRDVEVGEAEAVGRQTVDVWRIDRRSVAVQMREAQIVEEDDQHVGPVLGRGRQRRPPGLRVAEGAADSSFEVAVCRHVEPFSTDWSNAAEAGVCWWRCRG